MHLRWIGERCIAAIRKDSIAAAAFIVAGLIGLAIPLSCGWVAVLGHERPNGGFYADWMIVNGAFVYERVDTRRTPGPDDREWNFGVRAIEGRARREFDGYFNWRTLGFAWHRNQLPSWDSALLTIPLWVPCALLMLIIAIRLQRESRRVRFLQRGFCPSCGYDLRATPGRCTECGWTGTTNTS